ncbi:MAG: glycosyltransferase [Bacteroidia bacterium]|nr:glycosyltransferase [Bacteroidia bacterium]MDW8159471.1 glycosyltransferase [Bacteroidia bacterium]
MRILMVLPRFPYPLYKGDMLRAYYQIKELSKNHEVYIVCLTEDTNFAQYLSELTPYCKKIEVVTLCGYQIVWNLLRGLFNKYPFQVNYFRSKVVKKKLKILLEKYNIEVCYVQLIRMTLNVDYSYSCLYYLDYMDCFSAGMEKRSQYGNFLSKILFRWEAKRVKAFELHVAQKFHGYSVISEADKKYFPPSLQPLITVIPNGIAKEFLEFEPAKEVEKDIDILFTGNMGYAPNILAAIYLAHQILPLVKNYSPTVKVYLVGTNPSRKVRALASSNVVVTGFVHDIKPYLVRSKVFVAPLFTGSGLQNKLLEAMAMRLPVLTTPLAAEALNAKNLHEVIICKDAHEFSKAIYKVLTEPTWAQQIGNNARNFIQKQYSWKESTEKLINTWQELKFQNFNVQNNSTLCS